MINLAIMGYGTIGSGVAKILDVNRERIARNAGDGIALKYVLDLREFEGDPIFPKVVHDYMTIVRDPEVRIVVETMGGVEPAFTFVKAMLEAGKHVVTSNKALVADKGPELVRLAKEHDVNFLFEASVGGGIPIIRPLLTCITGDEIEEISGIVNGTTNFILTKMSYEGMDFDAALSEAQELGYAERDPSADIEGADACRKIAILTSVVLGQQVNFNDIYTEGITKITSTDIKYAKALSRSIKLIAMSVRNEDSSYACMVAPFMIEASHPLSQVNGAFNAIFVKGNMLGDSMFYGSGAGSLPTASAVLGDIVDCARHLNENVLLRYDADPVKLADHLALQTRFFVRTDTDISKVKESFGEVEEIRLSDVSGEYGFVTECISEKEYRAKIDGINVIGMIRLH